MNRSKTLIKLTQFAMIILGLVAIALGQTVAPTQGYPAVSTLKTASNGNTITAIAPSALSVDASQFPGAPDMCLQINNAYTSQQFTGIIDATAFTGIQQCVSNPFHGKNAVVHLYLNPNVVMITSVPWFTPQVTHSIEGRVAGDISGPLSTSPVGGATIEACGPTIPPAVHAMGLSWNGTGCTLAGSSGWTITGFPDTTMGTETVLIKFNFAHGPFPMGNYSCIICVGGLGGSPVQEGMGWNLDGDASRISGIKIDLGGVTNIFGYYTMASQERTELVDTRGGPACGNTSSQNCADVFYDRAEAPLGLTPYSNSGTTRPIIRDFNMAGEGTTATCSSCYGIAFEGSNIFLQINQGNCNQQPVGYVSSVNATSHTISSYTFINNGAGGCALGAGEPTCLLYGAPTSLSVSTGPPQILSGNDISPNSCVATIAGGVITGFTLGTPNSPFSSSFFTGGPLLEDINIDPGTTFENGVWIEGVSNAEISKVHCLNLLDDCISFSSNTTNTPPTAVPTLAGVIGNIDGNGTTGGALRLGNGIDNGQFITSLASGSGTILSDARNNVTISGTTLSQYNPGGASPVIGGLGLQGFNALLALNVTGGTGGSPANSITGAGNAGGGISLSTGAGSAGGTTSGNGGAGGAFTVTGGGGGSSTASSASGGGNGGSLNFTAGSGASGGSSGTGGTGGGIILSSGAGGMGRRQSHAFDTLI